MSIDILQQICANLFQQKKLEPFLKKIIFSNYKNFQPNTEIEFNYPLTVLVGRNGTNKSSVLKALHACIHGTSLADFWFETDLDPIHAASYWYTYDYVLPNSDKVEAQVYLTKRKREGNIDYWETSAPSTAIGMQPYPDTKDPKFSSLPNKTRWMKINPDQKSSTYLSFRESLSCFDQFYYYGTYKWLFTKISERKDYIRANSKILAKTTNNNNLLTRYGKQRVFENMTLPINITQKISEILGVEYQEIKLIKHNLFNSLGYTCLLKKNNLSYSEAFAGAGEFSVINMVNRIENQADKSLILIDEPEVSLHPEAQKKFIEYLLNKIKVNKHQIVVATHSVEFIKLLPPEAIKLIKLNEENQAVIEKQYCLQEEAFIDLGNNNYEKHKIYVEDDVAKLILDSVLNKIVDINSDLFEVIVFPGGDSHIYGAIVATACVDNNRKCHVILDGDKDTGSVLLQPEQISQQMIARGELDNNIKDFVGSLSFLPCSSGGHTSKNIEIKKNFLYWARKNIRFLPSRGLNPEQFLLSKIGISNVDGNEAKSYFIEESRRRFPQLDPNTVKQILICEILNNLHITDPDIMKIKNILLEFMS